MSTEEDEGKLIYEKEIKELVRLVFEKARKDSRETSKTGKSKHIATEINSQINQRTLVRYYNQFSLEIDEGIKPNNSSLDIISKYLGFKDFADFCREVFPEKDLIPEKEKGVKKEKLLVERFRNHPKNNFRKKIVGTGIIVAISVGSYFGISAYNQPQCMYWKENHYEAVHCDEILHPSVSVIPISEETLEHFHKLEVSDTTTFFEAGKPIVWYSKVEGEIEFYSAPGNHPLTGNQLNPVTHYIVNKYVLK